MFHMPNLSLMLGLFEEPVTVVRVPTGTNRLCKFCPCESKKINCLF